MNQLFVLSHRLLSRCFQAQLIAVVLFIGVPAAAHSAQIKIVTDIAPVHSLVSMVVGEPNEVSLLIPASQSPHAYNLKPSQRRLIDNAQVIVMLSDAFTPSLSRHISSSKNDGKVVTLSQHAGEHSHSENDQHNSERKSERKSEHKPEQDSEHDLENDPHTWLNLENAIEWIDVIAAAAIQADNTQSEQFEQNAADAKQRLRALNKTLNDELQVVRAEPYIVYHDAYRHFAHGFSLKEPIAIALSDARAPGAARLRVVRNQAEQVNCAFSELLHDDVIVDMVTEKLSINRAVLDPIGTNQTIGASLYPNLMRALANNFIDCLSN